MTKQGKTLRNSQHASLCATALKGAALKYFRKAVKRRQTYIDMDLWRFEGSKKLYDSQLTVGMKGLKGRGGIGSGHKAGFGYAMDLRCWLGD